MSPETQSRRDIYLRRLLSAICWNIFVQGILTFCFVFVINADLLNPLTWMSTVLMKVFNFRCIPSVCSITLITLFQGIIYGRRYMNPPAKHFKRINAIFNLFCYDNVLFCVLYSLACYLSVRLYSSLSEDTIDLGKECLKYSNSQCLREENLFYQLGGVWIGLYYFSKNNVFRINMLTFPHIQQDKMQQVKTASNTVFLSGCKKAFYLTGCYVVFYSVLGGSLRTTIINTFSLFLEDDPLDSLMIIFSGTVFRIWVYFSFICISMHMFELMFNIVLTEPANFPINTENGLVLHQALDGSSPYVSLLAAQDLKMISLKDGQRRKELFTLSLPGSHPHNWKNILNQCIQKIDIFIDQMNELNYIKCTDTSNIMSINNPSFHSIKSPTIRPISSKTLTQSMQKTRDSQCVFNNNMKSTINNILKSISELPGLNYFFSELPQWRLKYLLAQAQLVIWTCESLAHLSASSLTEDRYGIVQNDLPLIITKLVQLKQSLDRLSKMGLLAKKLDANTFNSQMKIALISGIRRSIYRVVISFSKHLDDIGLSSDVRTTLEPFINFRES